MTRRHAITLMGMAILIGVISVSLARADTAAIIDSNGMTPGQNAPVPLHCDSGTVCIDFEGLAEGAIVSELSCGTGIDCPNGNITGSVAVSAGNQRFYDQDTDIFENTAMIFNADCDADSNDTIYPDCSGQDFDLGFPGHGNMLINSENLDSSDPDDQDEPDSFMEFDFSQFGPGQVTVHSINVTDVEFAQNEAGAFLHIHSDEGCSGHPLVSEPGDEEIPIDDIGDHNIVNIKAEFSQVQCFHVHLNGSGSIDNIQITVAPTPAPAIDIEKLTNGEDADDPTGPVVPVGSIVEFTYLVTNTGNVNLTNVSVSDDQGVPVNCPRSTLSAGPGNNSMTCTGNTTASAGQYANIGTACGDGAGQRVCDEDPSHHFGVGAAIDIEKLTNGQDADDPNGDDVPVIIADQPVTWTYVVKNTGDVPLANVEVVDDQGVVVSCDQDTLAVNEFMTCTASGTAQDLSSDPTGVTTVPGCGTGRPTYENQGTVTANPPVGGQVTDQDLSHYCNPLAPAPVMARITGGGWRVTGSNGEEIRSSGGFTLHCDITLSNNLQINWGKGDKWHINKVVDAAYCKDDPAYTPYPPVAPADTYFGLDVGKLNNTDGSVACFKLEDHGETAKDPDGPDQALIRIWAPGHAPIILAEDLANPGFDCTTGPGDDPYTDPHTVLYVPESDIQGNFQFHEDQPHRNGNGRDK